MENDVIKLKEFGEVNLNDSFFDSLRMDYSGFNKWFIKKAEDKEKAYVLEDNGIQGFLYLKQEYEDDPSIVPDFPLKRRLKIGTFKINAHGTRLGERFIKIIIDEMYYNHFEETYVTVFPKYQGLIKLLQKYGFVFYGHKNSTAGKEDVYVKYFHSVYNDSYLDYPKINIKNNNKFLLSIWPNFHTRMFPNSRLRTERHHFIDDISYTNSIEKIYLSGAYNLNEYKEGDLVVIYRTADTYGRAEYQSVATSICTVLEIRHIDDFQSIDDFLDYCIKFSVFSEDELRKFWNERKYPYLIKMLYNIALNKRPIRKQLIEEVGLSRDERWVAVKLTDEQFNHILKLGEVNENLIIY